MDNPQVYRHEYVLDLHETIMYLQQECRTWRNQFLEQYSIEQKLHKDEYKYIADYFFEMDKLPEGCIGFYDLISSLRDQFKVNQILKNYSYTEILEKMESK